MPGADEAEPALTALVLGSTTREQECAPAIVERLRLIAGVISQALARGARDNALRTRSTRSAGCAIARWRRTWNLRREVKVLRTSRPIVSESPAIQQVLAQVEQVAPTPATVLLLGETGTGKEVMAQAIHDLSPRHQRPMIRVSCAAIPTSLIESELFGREKGAYTGALSRQIGRFEAANQSTLFLDEIGDLPLEVQVKLLRVLQERVIERLGSTQPDQGRRPHHRGHEPQPRGRGPRQDVSRGSVLSPQRLPHRRAAAARTRRGHPRAGVELHR